MLPPGSDRLFSGFISMSDVEQRAAISDVRRLISKMLNLDWQARRLYQTFL
jgi:hypothetical protein